MNRNLLLAAIGVIAVAIGAFTLTNRGTETTPLAAVAQSTEGVDTSSIVDMTLGAEDAPIEMIEYASFTCPHCRTFHENAFKDLKREYIDTGKVKFVLREVYFDRYGLWAGMVARCGEGKRYFGIVDLIFENQSEWTQGEPVQIAGNLKRFGKLAGMDDATLDACLQDREKATALTAFYQENATADGIRATPSFVIDGVTMDNMSYADLKEVLDAKLN
jgi:protein-disulfide isomerase